MIRLVILGAGTAIPMPRYSPAGSLVQLGDVPILVDIGPGTLMRLAAAGIDYRDLDYIFLTHHHSDHTLDLVTLIQAFDSTPGWKRTNPLHLIGGLGTVKFFDQLMATYPGIEPNSYKLEFNEMSQESLNFPGWTVRSALTGHTANSLGYRFEAQGKSIVFSGDATFSQRLIQLADQADIFICECSYPGNTATSDHLAAEQAGKIAHEARVKSLVLVHLYPHTIGADLSTQVGKVYSGQIETAFDGLELRL